VVRHVRGVPPRNLALIWHADRQLPASAATFVDLAAQVCEELRREWAA
jgi:hypothetical protein